MINILISILFSILLTPSPEVCDAIHTEVGGEALVWDSASYGWPDLPKDILRISSVKDDLGRHIWTYHSDTDNNNYVFVFISYERTTDKYGNHFGAHEFCGPFKISTEGDLDGN